MELPNEKFAVFIMATFGEGEPTDNAQRFYEWICGDAAALTQTEYAVFGLGNRQYEHFCAVLLPTQTLCYFEQERSITDRQSG